MSSHGSDKIQALLIANSTLTALLDTFSGYPAIFHDRVCPDNFTGRKYILYYRTAPTNTALPYTDADYTINCRANNYYNAENIQKEVNSTLSRKNTLTGKGLCVCSVLPIIPPQDETDDYNGPVEVKLKLV